MHRIKFSILSILLSLSASILVTGCTSKEIPDNETLVVAMAASPKTLDPRFATDAAGQRLSSLLFNSLVRLGPDLAIIPDAADTWEYKDKVYTFQLKPGLTFSNGRAVTEDDIKFSFATFQSDKSPFKSAFSSIVGVETDFSKEPRIVRLKLSDFSASLLTDLTNARILPKDIVEKRGDDFPKELIGTGPFTLQEQTANQIVLKARSDYAFKKPGEKTVIFKIIQDDNTRYLKTLKGAIDIAQAEIPLSKAAEFEKNKDFQVFKYTGASMDYFLFNMKDPVLGKKDVRLAFANALNRDEIIQFKLNGLAIPSVGILPPENPFASHDLKNPPFDLAKAKELVKTLKLGDKEFILKTSNNPEAVEKAKVLVNQFEQAGLKIKLQSFEWGTFYSDISSGNFQLATMRWAGATDPDIYRVAFHSREIPKDGKGRNRGSYNNPKLDTLLDEGLKIEDQQKRITHYEAIQKIVSEDLPMLPLWHEKQVAVVHNRVKGYSPPKNGDYSPVLTVTK